MLSSVRLITSLSYLFFYQIARLINLNFFTLALSSSFQICINFLVSLLSFPFIVNCTLHPPRSSFENPSTQRGYQSMLLCDLFLFFFRDQITLDSLRVVWRLKSSERYLASRWIRSVSRHFLSSKGPTDLWLLLR